MWWFSIFFCISLCLQRALPLVIHPSLDAQTLTILVLKWGNGCNQFGGMWWFIWILLPYLAVFPYQTSSNVRSIQLSAAGGAAEGVAMGAINLNEVCDGSYEFFFCILICLQIRRALTFGQSDCRRRKCRQLTHAYVLNWAVLRGDWRSPINRIVWDITMLTLLLPLFLFILIGKKRRCYWAERQVGSQGLDPSGK